MGRIQVLVAAGLLAFAGLAIAGDSAGAQVGNLDKSCKKGFVLVAGPGTQYDTDGNGFVCVDPTTGDVRDDKGQFVNQAGIAPSGPAADENGDLFVCYDATRGVYTDDDISSGQPACPPGFLLVPAFFVP
jgi:hypothetical protein